MLVVIDMRLKTQITHISEPEIWHAATTTITKRRDGERIQTENPYVIANRRHKEPMDFSC